ncbi:MAG: hypothetical protein ACRCZF_05225, partial [Gemmataceae bacterium]
IEPKQRYLGRCEFGPGRRQPTDDWRSDEILIALAGMVAEAQQTGQFDRAGAAQDLNFVRKLATTRAAENQY